MEEKIIEAINRQTEVLLANIIFDGLAKGGMIDLANKRLMTKKCFEAARQFIKDGYEAEEETPAAATIIGPHVN